MGEELWEEVVFEVVQAAFPAPGQPGRRLETLEALVDHGSERNGGCGERDGQNCEVSKPTRRNTDCKDADGKADNASELCCCEYAEHEQRGEAEQK